MGLQGRRSQQKRRRGSGGTKMDHIRFRLRILLVVWLTIMVLGTLGLMFAEGLSLADAFYFSIVTIATVGYGDIHPVTQAGKVLAIALIVLGVGSFLGVVANGTEMMLNRREKQARMQKLNMVVGLFFSEVGTRLLAFFSNADPRLGTLRNKLVVSNDWSDQDFAEASKGLRIHDYSIDAQKVELEALRDFLDTRTDVLLRLLEHPSLLENEFFTELLRAVFHLKEELVHRHNVKQLPDTDKLHLAGDIQRAYALLVQQWLGYMKHLKHNYPYLFSLAMRINPLDRDASPIVE